MDQPIAARAGRAIGTNTATGDGKMAENEIRKVMLEVVNQQAGEGPGFQSGRVLWAVVDRLGQGSGSVEFQQAILTAWYDLFRTGTLAWGYDLYNPNPSFCHLTDKGRRTLAHYSRDPSNPDGYLHYLADKSTVNPVAMSYIQEALRTYTSDCIKATAVMVGAAAESMVLEVRDALMQAIQSTGKTPPSKLSDWRIKTVLDAVGRELDKHKATMPKELGEAYEAYWSAFTHQIRTTRNEAGHPASIDPVSEEAVHAGLLMFPELAGLTSGLTAWIKQHYAGGTGGP